MDEPRLQFDKEFILQAQRNALDALVAGVGDVLSRTASWLDDSPFMPFDDEGDDDEGKGE